MTERDARTEDGKYREKRRRVNEFLIETLTPIQERKQHSR